MSVYVYENHLTGGYFTTTDDEYDGYCETCGDCDVSMGEYDTQEEADAAIAELKKGWSRESQEEDAE